METLKGKTALITGGSRGIGRAICLRLAKQGADIVLHFYRNRGAAEETVASIGREVTLVHADLSSVDEIETMFQQLGHLKLDFLINNAGIWKSTPLGSSPALLIDEILATNLKGPFWITQCALPLMKEGGKSSIFRPWQDERA
jgi:3-oxoacyl-[acyl-carrier protein] reductase